jgi:hypothetical protein
MLQLTGCFTEEHCLSGLTVNQIAKELGLPENRFKNLHGPNNCLPCRNLS